MDYLTVKKFRADHKALLEAAFNIREKVFIEGQKVPPELEKDCHDREALHYLLMLDGKYIGTARRRDTREGVKLERFAVLPQYRSRGAGSMLLKWVMDDLKGYPHTIYLNAQEAVVPFYERAGFQKVGGPFEEADIQHFRMDYKGEQ